jgi:23S rRNA pseudouridine1911/1915/1917 synthase
MERVDLFVSIHTGRSRAFVKEQIQQGSILLNAEVVTKPSHRLRPGDELKLAFQPDPTPDLVPIEKKLEILFEDPDLLVINKPKVGWCTPLPVTGEKL